MRNVPLTWIVDQMKKPLCTAVAEARRKRGLGEFPDLEYYISCYLSCLLSVYLQWRSDGMRGKTLDDLVGVVRSVAAGALDKML